MSLRFVFTKGIAMCKPGIVKERKKNAKKLTMKNVLNDKKYHEIFQNSKILHILSKLQGGIFPIGNVLQLKDHLKVLKTKMTFFYPKWQGTHHRLLPTFDLNYSKTT